MDKFEIGKNYIRVLDSSRFDKGKSYKCISFQNKNNLEPIFEEEDYDNSPAPFGGYSPTGIDFYWKLDENTINIMENFKFY